MQDAQQVYEALREIAAFLRFDGAPRFKVDAFEQGAEVVKTVGAELGARVEQDRLRELQGIGATLSRQIHELWNSGSSSLLEQLRATHPPGAAELIRMPGMTPRRIALLHEALGISSVEQLLAACAAGQVQGVPGFGAKTEQKLREAGERYLARKPKPPARLLLAEALALVERLRTELGELGERLQLAGELRRGEELVGRLELFVAGDVAPVIEALKRLRSVLRFDEARNVAFLAQGIELELASSEVARAGNGWLEATGNAAHLASVRARAATHAVSLEAQPFASEAELYRALGLAFVPPELRQGTDELSLAEAGGFEDLIALGDVRGAVHCHTIFSDGRASVLEMAQAAHALGLDYITITDHSPSAHYASGVALDRLRQQWDEIAAAQEIVPIRILRGTESDILSDGSLDYPDAVLERFDVIIASIHARHKQDRATMTGRLVRAMALPVFKIWGHALGRILNHRDPIDCDVPRVLDALQGSRGAIELNADPHRLDLPPQWIPEARRRGIPFVLGVDAHSTRGLQALPHGITQARRGGLRRREVLNSLTADEFAARVRPRP
ncbi:MAG TPA: helix-hairpin-helix domain-containing protein [Polyangiaceae bacterium]|nr:helix-hairpin-helix domain-containing protein [Polyangiaceae bacterium]